MKSLPVELKKVRDTVAACGWRECVKSIDSILVGAEAASILKSTAAIKFQFFGISYIFFEFYVIFQNYGIFEAFFWKIPGN